METEGYARLLRELIGGEIQVIARDLTEPSPLALEVLSARPYAFLDDAPLEERRTQAVMSRRWIDPESAADIGKLDPDAISRVREEAWPDAATPDELHDALLWLTYMTDTEVQRNPAWPGLMHQLMTLRRVLRLGSHSEPTSRQIYIAAERQALFDAVFPGNSRDTIAPAADSEKAISRESAL